MSKSYELLYLVPSQITEDELSGITEKVKKIVEQGGGQITKNELWGKRKLTYPIQQARQAYYWLMQYTAEGDTNKKVTKELKLIPTIVRFLISETVKPPVKKPETVKPRTVKNIETEAPPPAKKEDKATAKDDKVSLEDLDRKLDELLDEDIEQN